MAKEPMRQCLVQIPRGDYESLKAIAVANDRTVAAEVRRAVRQHLDSESGERMREMMAEMLERLDGHQEDSGGSLD